MTLPGWTAVLAARYERDRFTNDMNQLRALGARALTAARHTTDTTIYTTIRAEMTEEALEAVSAPWPDFKTLWEAA